MANGEAKNVIDSVLGRLETILRYVAPGFVLLILIKYFGPNYNWFGDMRDSFKLGAVVFGGSLLGLTIYGVHSNFLIPLFLWRLAVIICKLLYRKHIPNNNVYKKSWHGGESMYELSKRRWLNRAPRDKDVNHLQVQLDKWGAMLNYLYCSGYAFLLVVLLRWLKGPELNPIHWLLVCIGLSLMIIALVSDVRITLYEFRFWNDSDEHGVIRP